MAVPTMIGEPGASIRHSGSRIVFDEYRDTLELLTTADHFGADPALYDFALLPNVYTMFTGFFHGAAILRSAGVPATTFADRAVAWVTAMANRCPNTPASSTAATTPPPSSPSPSTNPPSSATAATQAWPSTSSPPSSTLSTVKSPTATVRWDSSEPSENFADPTTAPCARHRSANARSPAYILE
ncbi:hypothetical protein [Nocardia sp. NPDC051463]|uniref:imine reductase family protein n=1 Tax=Nocardia sp. NPDC051463 TaxID=3154845 RepID=UPI0034507A91